jgi:hypothetical protein
LGTLNLRVPKLRQSSYYQPITFTSLEALYDAFQADMERILE